MSGFKFSKQLAQNAKMQTNSKTNITNFLHVYSLQSFCIVQHDNLSCEVDVGGCRCIHLWHGGSSLLGGGGSSSSSRCIIISSTCSCTSAGASSWRSNLAIITLRLACACARWVVREVTAVADTRACMCVRL